MWDLPGLGLEPVSPALAGGFLTTAPPGKSLFVCFFTFPHLFCEQIFQNISRMQLLAFHPLYSYTSIQVTVIYSFYYLSDLLPGFPGSILVISTVCSLHSSQMSHSFPQNLQGFPSYSVWSAMLRSSLTSLLAVL